MTRPRAARPPMSALAMLQQEVNELFQQLSILDRSDRLPGSEWSPAVDVLEQRDRLLVIVEVPGLAPETLKVAFRERALVLTGDRRAPRVGSGARFHCLERPHGKFERTIPLDLPVDVASRAGLAARRRPHRHAAAAARAPRPRDRHPDREGAHGMSEETKDEQDQQPKVPDVLPVLPLRDIVIFPFMIVPLYVSRDRSIRAVDQALAENRMILLAAQKKQDEDDPGAEDIYPVGTAALIMRMLKLPDGRIRVLVQGLSRARIVSYDEGLPHLQAHVETVAEPESARGSLEVEAMMRNVKAALEKSQNLGKPISPEVIVIANNMEEPGRLADLTASNLDLKVEGAQAILEALDPVERLRRVHELMTKELEVLTMQQEISSQAKGEMDRSQREFFLRQQLKAIQSELGEGNELGEEIAQLRDKATKAKMPKPVMEEVERQLKKLERMHPDAAETATLRNWLDWMVTLPWGKVSKDSLDLVEAQRILDEDHYGLEKVKERIVEYLAVRKLKEKAKGPLLVLRRPARRRQDQPRPLDRARARPQVRAALARRRQGRGRDPRPPPHLRRLDARPHHPGHPPGRRQQPGVHDGRGRQDRRRLPRRPELGAARGARPRAEQRLPRPLPGRAVRPLERDVHLHREPDRHDPAGVPRPHGGDPALGLHRGREARDRQAPPGAEAARGARPHAREPGVHGPVAQGDRQQLHARGGPAQLRARDRAGLAQGGAQGGRGPGGDGARRRRARSSKFLGAAKTLPEERLKKDTVGIATGLAWTATGGDVLFVEASIMKGKGRLTLTGQLGDVMKESAQAALSAGRAATPARTASRTRCSRPNDLHVHVPEGAIPKDGPSAGITMATAILSALTGQRGAQPASR